VTIPVQHLIMLFLILKHSIRLLLIFPLTHLANPSYFLPYILYYG
jgi:hypothetical protein